MCSTCLFLLLLLSLSLTHTLSFSLFVVMFPCSKGFWYMLVNAGQFMLVQTGMEHDEPVERAKDA